MNITLIGMSGVGKTAIGRELSNLLGQEFIDTDDLIVHGMGEDIHVLLKRVGPEKFIEIEEQIITGLVIRENTVIATGGSAVYSGKAMQFLKDHSKLVFLNADYENIRSWIDNLQTRGIVDLKGRDLKEVYDERLPIYRKYADLSVELGSGYSVKDSALLIAHRLGSI